jgi:hypothetical protein
MAVEEKLLKEILVELREIRYWTKVSSLPVIRRAAHENLRDDESKLVYDLSDGQRSTREIAEELKKSGKTITHATVANMWKRWATVSLVESSERYQGRFKKVAPLESFGIEAPEIKKEGEEIR